jgi:hypothetical protein
MKNPLLGYFKGTLGKFEKLYIFMFSVFKKQYFKKIEPKKDYVSTRCVLNNFIAI